MARRTFFSFHYQPDVQRAQVVKQCWVTKEREDAGFFDASAMEKAKRTNPDAIRNFLTKEMEGSSVVCALVGADTALRPWVRFEIMRGIWDQRGLLAVRIHTIKNWQQQTTTAGTNPLDLLGVYVEATATGKSVKLIERASVGSNWQYAAEFTRVLPKWPYGAIPQNGSHALSSLFQLYDWSANGRENIGTWIEIAAKQAGR